MDFDTAEAGGCLTVIAELLGAKWLWGWANKKDREYAAAMANEQDKHTMTNILLSTADQQARKWNHFAREMEDDDAGPQDV